MDDLPGAALIEGMIKEISTWDADWCEKVATRHSSQLTDARTGRGMHDAFEAVTLLWANGRGTPIATTLDRVYLAADNRTGDVFPAWLERHQLQLEREVLDPPTTVAHMAVGVAAVAIAGDKLSRGQRAVLTSGWNKVYGRTKITAPPRSGIIERLGFRSRRSRPVQTHG